MHVPWAHYTISLVKECRFVVKGCRFASVREKCMCYIWVGNHHGHWYRFFIFNNRKIEVSLQIRGGGTIAAKAIVAARFLRTKGSGGSTVPMQVQDDKFPLRRIA